MNAQDVAVSLLKNVYGDGTRAAQLAFSRFEQAYAKANPSFSEEMFAPYDTLLANRMPEVVERLQAARIAAVEKVLTPDDVEVWEKLLQVAEATEALATLRRTSAAMGQATDSFFRSEGVQVHARCVERMLNTIAGIDATENEPRP